MALLTAEDVLNKAFSKTKYREGFDQDEVDDFLDEIAHTISSLTAERDDLAARLQAALSAQPSQGVGDSLGSPYGASPAPAVPAPAPAPAPAASVESGGVPAVAAESTQSPTGMLAMAQKLHDEYVTSAEAEKKRIVSEAQAEADRILNEAQTEAKTRMDDLVRERGELERKIDDLRRFERDYRSRLTTYLENLLGDLDHGAGKDRAPGDERTP